MKKLILLLLIVFSFSTYNLYSQSYSEVVTADSITADNLYSRSKVWVAKTFVSANNVIQADDPIGKIIVAKGLFKEYEEIEQMQVGSTGLGIVWRMQPKECVVNFTIQISCKDGKYKYVIDQITYGDNHQSKEDFTRQPDLNQYTGFGSKWTKRGAQNQYDFNLKIVKKSKIGFDSLIVGLKQSMLSGEDKW